MRIILTILAILCSINAAEARKSRHVKAPIASVTADTMNPMFFSQSPVQTATFGKYRDGRQPQSFASAQILSHPSGCPRRAFCGCGAAVEKFGSPRRDLWTARAWFAFPKVGVSSASGGDAMVRAHHVAILRSHVQGTLWLVADHNSGGGKSRLHVRDIRGWTIVRPG